jgi:hypothetical protein
MQSAIDDHHALKHGEESGSREQRKSNNESEIDTKTIKTDRG